MIDWLKSIFQPRLFGGRSSKWPALRKSFLKGRVCAVCGGINKLQAHHIKDFSHFPELELEVSNLLPLCESGKHGINCHLFVGHLGDFHLINPDSVEDSRIWYQKFLKARV